MCCARAGIGPACYLPSPSQASAKAAPPTVKLADVRARWGARQLELTVAGAPAIVLALIATIGISVSATGSVASRASSSLSQATRERHQLAVRHSQGYLCPALMLS